MNTFSFYSSAIIAAFLLWGPCEWRVNNISLGNVSLKRTATGNTPLCRTKPPKNLVPWLNCLASWLNRLVDTLSLDKLELLLQTWAKLNNCWGKLFPVQYSVSAPAINPSMANLWKTKLLVLTRHSWNVILLLRILTFNLSLNLLPHLLQNETDNQKQSICEALRTFTKKQDFRSDSGKRFQHNSQSKGY